MSCELISSRKIDYYVFNPYAEIIDLRSKYDFDLRHIKNAKNFEFKYIENIISNNKAFLSEIFPKNMIYIIYCERGTNSLIICNKMSNLGYNVKSIVGGICNYKGKYLMSNGKYT